MYPIVLDEVSETPIASVALYDDVKSFRQVEIPLNAALGPLRLYLHAKAIVPRRGENKVSLYGYNGDAVVFTSSAILSNLKSATSGTKTDDVVAFLGAFPIVKSGTYKFRAISGEKSNIAFQNIFLVFTPRDSEIPIAKVPLFNRDIKFDHIDIPLSTNIKAVRVFLTAKAAYPARGETKLKIYARKGNAEVLFSSAKFSTLDTTNDSNENIELIANVGSFAVEVPDTYSFFALADGPDEIGINHIDLVLKPKESVADKYKINLAFALATILLVWYLISHFISEQRKTNADLPLNQKVQAKRKPKWGRDAVDQ